MDFGKWLNFCLFMFVVLFAASDSKHIPDLHDSLLALMDHKYATRSPDRISHTSTIPIDTLNSLTLSCCETQSFNFTIPQTNDPDYVVELLVVITSEPSLNRAVQISVSTASDLNSFSLPMLKTDQKLQQSMDSTFCAPAGSSVTITFRTYSVMSVSIQFKVSYTPEDQLILVPGKVQHLTLPVGSPKYGIFCWPPHEDTRLNASDEHNHQQMFHATSADYSMRDSVRLEIDSPDDQCALVVVQPGRICGNPQEDDLAKRTDEAEAGLFQTMTTSSWVTISPQDFPNAACFHYVINLYDTNFQCLRDDGDKSVRESDRKSQTVKNVTVAVEKVDYHNYLAVLYYCLICVGIAVILLLFCTHRRTSRYLRAPVYEVQVMDEMFLLGPGLARGSYIVTILVVAVFYLVPAVQFLIYTQSSVRLTGNNDICYYNFKCANRLGIFVSFNNVVSNSSYIIFGIVFIFMVHIKHTWWRYAEVLYTIGVSLILEGILSACYHLCPRGTNFQFDTTMMYVIAGLCIYYLHYVRNPKSTLQAYFFFAFYGCLVFVVVMSIIAQKLEWIVVMSVIYVLTIVGFGITFYSILYFGSEWTEGHKRSLITMTIVHSAINLALLAYSIYQMYKDQSGFASLVLNFFVANLLLFTGFYLAMKIIRKEVIVAGPILTVLGSMICWGFALYFFASKSTDWRQSAAVSRSLNHECILFNFFDSHDVWHFLSALSLFLSFVLLLTIDEGQNLVTRPKKSMRAKAAKVPKRVPKETRVRVKRRPSDVLNYAAAEETV